MESLSKSQWKWWTTGKMEQELGNTDKQKHVHMKVGKFKKEESRKLNRKDPGSDGVKGF